MAMIPSSHTTGAAGTLVFIDSCVVGWQTLVEGLPPGSQWQLIDGASDGLAQIAAALAGRSGVQAVHIVSHGAQGSIQLGATVLTADSLHANTDALAALGASLADDGDILLYGCEAGAGSAGAALVDTLAALTGADVAASVDATGGTSSGGNWVLERSQGQVEAAALGSDGRLDDANLLLATSVTFDFTSGFTADTSIDGFGTRVASQLIGTHTLTLTANTGLVSVVNEEDVTGYPDAVMDAKVFAVDANVPAPTSIRLELDSGKLFDLTSLKMLDYFMSLQTLRITTNRGQVDVALALDGLGQQLVMPSDARLMGVSWAEISSPDGQWLAIELDDIVLSNVTRTPAFVGGTTVLNLPQNGGAADLSSLLRVSDTDAGETLTWTVLSGPSSGSMQFTGATASSGGGSIAPGGTVSYTPNAGFAGRDSFSVQVSDGSASATKTITVDVTPQRPGTADLAAGSDSGTSNSDKLTNATSLAFSGTSASGDSSSTVRVFVDANGNGAYDIGEASDTAFVSNGSWSVDAVPAAGLSSGSYNVYAQVTSATASLTSSVSTPLQVTIDRTAPTTSFSSISLSNDTGTSNTDRVTYAAAQTISATLSQALAAGDKLEGSLDNGATWTDLTSKASGTSLTWTGATLAAGGGIRLRVADAAGNAGSGTSAAYTLDQSAPATTVASALFSPDGGSDFILGAANQSLYGGLSANLAAGERVEVSLNNGASWSTADTSTGSSAWSLSGITLAGSNTLQVRVVDAAGNQGGAYTRAYVLDQSAPTATTPASTQLLAPSGASFTVAVTYADSGAGIDAASFGTGNIGVTGPLGGNLTVTGYSVSGSTVTYTVAAPGGSWDVSDEGSYTVAIKAGSVRDLAGNAVAANAGAGTVDVAFSSAPGVSALRLSADNGSSGSDFITNVAAQTIGATLSRVLAAGEVVYGSLDNGATWSDITSKVSGAAVAWDGVTLAAGGTIVLKVEDSNGLAGAQASHAYALDTGVPAQTVSSAALATDSGASGDFITNSGAQSLAGTLGAPLAAGEFVEVSFDNGGTWTTVTASDSSWSLGGFTLPAAGTLQVRVSDVAGNHGTAWTHSYQLDTAAPAAATPVRADMVDPAGASFSFTVTYADSGAGIDAATIGTGNVSVSGPAGSLTVTGASASGNTVTYTAAAPGGGWDLPDAGAYTIGINAQVKDLAGNTVAASASAASFAVAFAAPAVAALRLSDDSGGSGTDFITRVGVQTIGATLSRALIAGEVVQGSLDNGASWTVITSKVSGTELSWDGVNLPAGGTLVVRVLGTDGTAGTPASQAYALDTQLPAQAVASAALAADSGLDGDFITKVASQSLAGTLSAPLGAGEFVEVSLDNGGSWSTATAGGSAWSLNGVTLPAAGTLQVRVSDVAGNQGTAWSHSYQLDTAAPTAAAPVRADMTDPAGTSFSVTVTYADSGAGIDPATIGTGNVSVSGPGGALTVLAASASGNTVTYTVAAPGGSWDAPDAGSYTIGLHAQVRDLAGNTVAADAGAGSFGVVFAAPAVGALRLSSDSGTGNTDFITKAGAQTIGATLSRPLVAGEVVQGSLDNGATWTVITSKVSGTTLSWDGVSLPASGTLVVRVLGTDGTAGTPASQAYAVDAATPAQSVASAALAADSGAPGDFMTNVAAQTIYATLDAPLGAGDFVEVSLDNGATWTTATSSGGAWSLNGVTLPAAGTLQVRVSDTAGNQGTAWTHGYQLDTAAPLAGTPVRANMVDPLGASFSFTVTYADGGAGIDPASIGTGNVSVGGPGGALSVLAASAAGNTVTYTVAAPGGAWDPLDAGAYMIAIHSQVRDLAGNEVAPNAAAHGFTVGVNSAPLLGGVFATPTILDTGTAAPFAGVSLGDLDDDAITLTIAYTAANGALAGAGLAGSAGNYTLSGSAAAVQAALRGLVFTATANQSSGAAVTTGFTLSASDGKATTTNSTTLLTALPVAPTVTIALSDTDLRAGESATLTLNFSEAVTGLSAAELTLPDASLGAFSSSDGGRSWSALLTPAAGIASSARQVQLDLGGVLDAGGLAGSGTVAGPNYTLATARPTAVMQVSDTTLGVGETTILTISFSEAVSGFTLADLALDMGSLSELASSDGGLIWTARLTPHAGVQGGALAVRLDMAGVQNAAGNAGSGIVYSNIYAVETMPEPAAPVLNTTIDGVQVASSRYLDAATGLDITAVGVPLVTAGRTDDPSTPNAPLADIPLHAAAGGAGSTLTVGLPVGAGLQASGPSSLLGNGQALLDLIRRIEQNSTEGSAARREMTGEGSAFLQELAGSTLVQTATVTPSTSGGATDVLISGSGAGNASAIGLVIDAAQLAGGTTLRLDHVDFAAVIGGATLRGGAGDNTVVGDDASQNMFLGEGDDQLYGGGGDDVLGSAGGADLLDGGRGNDVLAGGIGNDQLVGGAGDDLLQGGRSSRGEWQFRLAADGTLGAVHQTAVFAPGAHETLALAALDKDAAELAFLSGPRAALTDMALLYQAAFDRAPDLGGLNYYLSHDVSAASVARAIAASAEWNGDGMHTLLDAAFVNQLYRNVLGRDGDSAGLAFWTAKLSGPAALSRADMLLAFALADEHRALHAGSLVIASASVDAENGWISGSGDDRLDGGAGSDLLVGGDGVDTVVYAGKLADYRILLGADGMVKVADKANADVDTLLGIERGAFADGTVDLAFTQAGTATLHTVGLLYQGLLGRAGELAGITWWAGTGMDGAGLVSSFAASPEFVARHGAMSDAAFVAALYANAGLATEAAGGSAAWVAMLQDHSRAELIGSWIAQDTVRDALSTTQGLWLV